MSEKEEGFFQIPYQRISRDDIRVRMEEGGIVLSDAALSDEFMQEVASKMGDSLVDEGWWDVLEASVEAVCELWDIDFENGTKCIHCGSYDVDYRSDSTFENQSIKKEIKTFYCNACDKYFNIEV